MCPKIHYKFDGNPHDVVPGTILVLEKDITPVCRCLLIMAQVQFGPQGPALADLFLKVDGVSLHTPVAGLQKTFKNLQPSCLPGHAVAVAQVTTGQAHVVSLVVQIGDPQNPVQIIHRSITVVEGDCAQFDIVPILP